MRVGNVRGLVNGWEGGWWRLPVSLAVTLDDSNSTAAAPAGWQQRRLTPRWTNKQTSKQTIADQKWSWMVDTFLAAGLLLPSARSSLPFTKLLCGWSSDGRLHTTALVYILTEVQYVRATRQRKKQGVDYDSQGDRITGIISLPFLIPRGLSGCMFPHW